MEDMMPKLMGRAEFHYMYVDICVGRCCSNMRACSKGEGGRCVYIVYFNLKALHCCPAKPAMSVAFVWHRGSEIRGLREDARRDELYRSFLTNARRVPVKAGSLLLWNSR